MTAAEIVHSNHKKLIGINRLAGADHVVPPTDIFRIVRVMARDVVVSGQRMANQDRVGLVGIQLAVSLINQLVTRQHRAAAEDQRSVE